MVKFEGQSSFTAMQVPKFEDGMPPMAPESNKVKRQPLSCLKCRQRKVKCDRVKPCQACCVRGQPRECEFAVTESEDYASINQAQEIRKLRAENEKLKNVNKKYRERLETNGYGQLGADGIYERRDVPTVPRKPARFQQKRFKGSEASDNLYFGSPGLASVVEDFARMQIRPGGGSSVTHAAPRGVDIFALRDAPLYAFPTLWRADGQAAALLDCLPPHHEILEYLDAFQRRAQSCSFPHVPEEITQKEVERFLHDKERNALKYPDMLALLFAAMAQGLQNGVYDKCGGEWKEGAMEAESWRGDLFIAAAMQALRVASFMNRPTLLGIQTLVMIGPYLTNSGKFLDAWALFGVTIRLAQSIGLHRNPQALDPAPPLRECSVRQALWWWMLHMDQQYSMTLGRPLGISGIGDCPPPEPLTTNPTILRLSEYINSFTIMARQILSSDRLTTSKIDEFTDRLLALLETLPEIVQFDETWLDIKKPIPDWPLDAIAAVFYGKTHNFLILLNRQRQENEDESVLSGTTNGTGNILSNGIAGSIPSSSSALALRGRDRVLESARALLQAFQYFHLRVRPAMICWTMGQQAFNASMILTLSLLHPSTVQSSAGVERDTILVHQAYATFNEMHDKGIHKLAGMACQKLQPLLLKLRQSDFGAPPAAVATETADPSAAIPVDAAPQADTVMGNTGMILLEDPGLQGFVPEAFAPLGFQMAGSNLPGPSEYSVNGNASEPMGGIASGCRTGLEFTVSHGGLGIPSPQWAARPAPYQYSNGYANGHAGPDFPSHAHQNEYPDGLNAGLAGTSFVSSA